MTTTINGAVDLHGHDPAALDDLTDRFASLLRVPRADPEVRDIVAMLQGALRSAEQTGRSELLDDALRFAHERLRVRTLTRAGPDEIGAALVVAAGEPLAAPDRDRLHLVLSRRRAHALLPATQEAAPGLAPLAADYVEHLLLGDRRAALALARRCLTSGMEATEMLLDVLEPALHEVGRRWAAGQISIAQEHFCTAVTQFVMTDLYPGIFTGVESDRRLMAVQAPGSLHHVGLRMVVDVLECHGWSTTYLGDDATVEDLPNLVAEDQADLLLVSASMPSQIPHVSAMVRAIRDDPRTRDVRVVVGGRPFRVAPDLVEAVGADGWAPDARTAVDVCDALMGDHRDQD